MNGPSDFQPLIGRRLPVNYNVCVCVCEKERASECSNAWIKNKNDFTSAFLVGRFFVLPPKCFPSVKVRIDFQLLVKGAVSLSTGSMLPSQAVILFTWSECINKARVTSPQRKTLLLAAQLSYSHGDWKGQHSVLCTGWMVQGAEG
jgi:hypothetical protein